MRYVVCLWMHRMAGDSCLGVSQVGAPNFATCAISTSMDSIDSNQTTSTSSRGKGRGKREGNVSSFPLFLLINIFRPFEPVEPGNLHPTQKFTLRHEMRHKIQVHEALTCCMHANVVPNSYQ